VLPADFRWFQRPDTDGSAWLSIGDKCVAAIGRRLDGSYFTVVNRHRPPRMQQKADCATPEQGRRWVERWAAAHAERLRREPDGFHNPQAWEPAED
jgi:hypothetical protein